MYIFTREGIEIQKIILRRKESEYIEICNERKAAHDLSGDGWHDNPHFNRLQQLEANKNHEIKELQKIISSAEIIDINSSQRITSHVAIGSFVSIHINYIDKKDNEIQLWEIVGYGETDLQSKKLAYNTPIANAIMGLEIGDEIECVLPKGMATIYVNSITEKYCQLI